MGRSWLWSSICGHAIVLDSIADGPALQHARWRAILVVHFKHLKLLLKAALFPKQVT